MGCRAGWCRVLWAPGQWQAHETGGLHLGLHQRLLLLLPRVLLLLLLPLQQLLPEQLQAREKWSEAGRDRARGADATHLLLVTLRCRVIPALSLRHGRTECQNERAHWRLG